MTIAASNIQIVSKLNTHLAPSSTPAFLDFLHRFNCPFHFFLELFGNLYQLDQVHIRRARNLLMMPYHYSERRFDSVILPVLSKLCNGLVLTELPVERYDKKLKEVTSEHGRMDYWCIYKGHTFIIEMKRTYDNLNGRVVRMNSMKRRWISMNDQINNPSMFIKNNLEEKTNGVIPIGLHFVTSMNRNKISFTHCFYQECVSDKEDYLDSFRIELSKTIDNKTVKPDYCGLWLIPEKIFNSSIRGTKDDFVCPYVMLFCQIGKMIKHIGVPE